MLSSALRKAFGQFSQVGPAMCGVMITFSSPKKGWLGAGGSSTITSSPAPPRWPDVIAFCSAASSTTGPRHVLMKMASGFMVANSRVDIRPRVASESGTCTVTMSEVRSSSSKRTKRTPSASSSSSLSRTMS